jgi:hypothetical protein
MAPVDRAFSSHAFQVKKDVIVDVKGPGSLDEGSRADLEDYQMKLLRFFPCLVDFISLDACMDTGVCLTFGLESTPHGHNM